MSARGAPSAVGVNGVGGKQPHLTRDTSTGFGHVKLQIKRKEGTSRRAFIYVEGPASRTPSTWTHLEGAILEGPGWGLPSMPWPRRCLVGWSAGWHSVDGCMDGWMLCKWGGRSASPTMQTKPPPNGISSIYLGWLVGWLALR